LGEEMTEKKKYDFEDLVRIMEKLRSENGCPWDREQTHRSLVKYLIEETYEVVDAILKEDYENLKEELGDLLLQVVFHSQIAKESGNFEIGDVVDSICRKLIERHPHVFGNETEIKTSEDVLRRWESFKKKKSVLEGIPSSLPALNYALKVQERLEKVGFDWPDFEGVVEKLKEEVEEIKKAVSSADKEKILEEVGDLLFMAVNLSRFLKVDPELALRSSVEKFKKRVRFMEEEAKKMGKKLEEMDIDEMETLWEKAKVLEKGGEL
jgi:tetrapyrrole methylase family protein/MazG family protein